MQCEHITFRLETTIMTFTVFQSVSKYMHYIVGYFEPKKV